MIKILILIQVGLVGLMAFGCNDDGAVDHPADVNPSTSVSGDGAGAADDPLKQLENEGKLPTTGTGGKLPVIGAPTGTVTDSLSLYPPSIDPDQDNIPNAPVTGHPEIALDNCPGIFNPGQEDANTNGVGDACE